MPSTAAQAKKEMFALLAAAWGTTGYPLFFPNMAGAQPEDGTPWARVTIRPLQGTQRSLATVQQRWENEGQIDIQIFTPGGRGMTTATDLVQLVLNTYRAATTPAGVRFPRVYEADGGPDGLYWMSRVVVTYKFDEYLPA